MGRVRCPFCSRSFVPGGVVRRYGVYAGHSRVPIDRRFWAKVEKGATPEACWKWLGSKVNGGYGDIGRGGSKTGSIRAHRLSWEMHVGPIPEGLWVLHKCDNPECTNPAHLFLGKQKENMADMAAKNRGYLFGAGNVSNQKGEAHWKCKLTDGQVRAIRAAKDRGFTFKSIARHFKISVTHACRLVARQARAEVV